MLREQRAGSPFLRGRRASGRSRQDVTHGCRADRRHPGGIRAARHANCEAAARRVGRGSDANFDLQTGLPTVAGQKVGLGLRGVVVGNIRLYLERVPDDIFGDAESGLAAGFVAGVIHDYRRREEGRVPCGNLPVAGQDVACLEVEPCASVNMLRHFAVLIDERVGADAPHQVGIESKSAAFEDEVNEIGLERPPVAIDHSIAVLALEATGAVVVAVGCGKHDTWRRFALEIAFGDIAQSPESTQRKEFDTGSVCQPAVFGNAEVASVAGGDRAFEGKAESIAEAIVVFAEYAEIAVEVKLGVDNAAVNELERARRVDARTVAPNLGLPEADVPHGRWDVVNHGVADDVDVAVAERFGIVGGEAQLDGVCEFGRKDVAVETQPDALDAGFGFSDGKTVVQVNPNKALHAQPQGELVVVVLGHERNAFPDFDVGHVAENFGDLPVVVNAGLRGRVGFRRFRARCRHRGKEAEHCRKEDKGLFHKRIYMYIMRKQR